MTAGPMHRAAALLALLAAASALPGCDVFRARTPEPPATEGGTFVQPDAPELVVENLRNAVAELNTANYRRSLADGLAVEPTAVAEARDPGLWAGWGTTEEVSYFTALAEAARLNSGHELRLLDPTAEVGTGRYTLDASYLLVVRHRRTGVPDTVQGRLAWEIEQGADGLWSLTRWRDQALGGTPSWSDLKAEFGR